MDDLLELVFEVICHVFGVEEKIKQKPKSVRTLLYTFLLAIVILSGLLVNILVMLWRNPAKSHIPALGLLGALLVSIVIFGFLLIKKFRRK